MEKDLQDMEVRKLKDIAQENSRQIESFGAGGQLLENIKLLLQHLICVYT